MEEKTPEQLEADNVLTNAIQQCLEAYKLTDPGFVLGDYVVLMSDNRFSQNGLETRHPILSRDGELPWYKILGLMQMAQIQAQSLTWLGMSNE